MGRLTNILTALGRVLKEIHSEAGKWSSKRVYGAVMIVSAIGITIYCVRLRVEVPGIVEVIFYTGAGLIGFGTSIKLIEAYKGGKSSKQEQEATG